MGYQQNGLNQFLGRGEVTIDRFDVSGAATGERFAGPVDDFKFNIKVDKAEKYSTIDSSLQAVAPIKTTGELTIVLTEAQAENLALFFAGSTSTFSQGSGTFNTGAPDSVVIKKDRWVNMAKRSASAVVVKDTTQATTYVLGTDYVLDLELGRIFILSTSAIADGATLKLEYAYGTVSQTRIALGTTPVIKAKVRFKSNTNGYGPRFNVEVWTVSISGDGDFGLVGNDFGTYTLKASVLADSVNHASEPYGHIDVIG